MQGELGSKHWGNRLPGSGGTAGPEHQNGFLIKESENPFRQAWLGNIGTIGTPRTIGTIGIPGSLEDGEVAAWKLGRW